MVLLSDVAGTSERTKLIMKVLSLDKSSTASSTAAVVGSAKSEFGESSDGSKIEFILDQMNAQDFNEILRAAIEAKGELENCVTTLSSESMNDTIFKPLENELMTKTGNVGGANATNLSVEISSSNIKSGDGNPHKSVGSAETTQQPLNLHRFVVKNWMLDAFRLLKAIGELLNLRRKDPAAASTSRAPPPAASVTNGKNIVEILFKALWVLGKVDAQTVLSALTEGIRHSNLNTRQIVEVFDDEQFRPLQEASVRLTITVGSFVALANLCKSEAWFNDQQLDRGLIADELCKAIRLISRSNKAIGHPLDWDVVSSLLLAPEAEKEELFTVINRLIKYL